MSEEVQVIPLAEEVLTVSKREIETGTISLRKTVTERTEVVDEPLIRTGVEVKRVVIDQFVDSPPPVRHENGVMIIPVLEEVLVVEKRLKLKEEIHVSQTRTEHHAPQSVILRTESVTEERIDLKTSLSEVGEARF